MKYIVLCIFLELLQLANVPPKTKIKDKTNLGWEIA